MPPHMVHPRRNLGPRRVSRWLRATNISETLMENLLDTDPLEVDLVALEADLAPAPTVEYVSELPPGDLVREIIGLEDQDIAMLDQGGPSHSYVKIKHIRAYHHIAALRLAAGEKAGVVASSLNLTPATLSRLSKDEQFQDLVEHYRGELVQKGIDTFEIMHLVSQEAALAIHERLINSEERDGISVEGLRRIAETFADRTGNSPIRRSQSINLHATGALDDEALRRIKALHPEDALYRPEDHQQLLATTHTQEAKDQGAKASISEIFQTSSADETNSDPSEGSGV